ncbi:RHS repeat domain-containing protein [Snodgrassella alvi]|uniref:RHS repeat domain-containing protein n=1 Tax=Snodgrassella alvi TaxID=1196083 RepID=UPI000C1F0342|nr:RHS repeat-associated core domain-containing protein [Snodgrassella alvi]
MIQETGPNHPTSLYIYTDQHSYEPLARIDTDGNQEQYIRYFHTDLNGCPEELTDENGELLWECSFQLWGKRIHEIEHEPIEQNLRYQGQYLDRETGLHYNTFRYYDPDIGRFTQPDPIGLLGSFNLYQYAPNGFTWIDPLGLHVSHGIDVLADDWATKGAHAHIDKMEIAIKPGKNGEIIYKPVFSNTNAESIAWKKATNKLDDYLSNPRNKAKVVDYLENAKVRWPRKGAEWNHLQKALKKHDIVKGKLGKMKKIGC